MKIKHTPLSAAKALRIGFEGMIAKTWDDHNAMARHEGAWLNHYQFAKLVQEQADCSFRKAFNAMAKVVPEMFAEYWETLPL